MNYQTLARQVHHMLDSGRYHWVSTDSEPEDYISPDNCWPSADAVIQAMIEEGDLEAVK
jgi:hypothetical protein